MKLQALHNSARPSSLRRRTLQELPAQAAAHQKEQSRRLYGHQGQGNDRRARPAGRRDTVRRLRNGYHRRERRPRGHPDTRRAEQGLPADEETATGKEHTGPCKNRRGHADALHRNHQKHHHGQRKRVCLPQVHRPTPQNKGLLRTNLLFMGEGKH